MFDYKAAFRIRAQKLQRVLGWSGVLGLVLGSAGRWFLRLKITGSA